MSNVIKLAPRRFGTVEHPAMGIVQLRVIPEVLSDNSVVYNVKIGSEITLHAIGKAEADALVETIARAIDDNTVDVAEVVS